MNKIVIADLPRVGLANMIFIWANGLVYSKKNNLDFYTFGWTQFHFGAYFRRERTKRKYVGFFKEKTNYSVLFKYWLTPKSKLRNNPDINVNLGTEKEQIIVFNQIPYLSKTDNIFESLAQHKELIKKEFLELLSSKILEKYHNLEVPEIGVHVRRGDFNVLGLSIDQKHYVNCIAEIRKEFGGQLKVKVFSDGYEHELNEILALGNIELVRNKEDILDLLQLSKSKFLVLTPRSTFSLWAAFFSSAIKVL